MPFQPVPNTVQISMHHVGTGELLGSTALWSFYTRLAAAPTAANVQAIVDQAVLERGAKYLPLLHPFWTLERIKGRSLAVEGGPTYERLNLGPGTRAGGPLPPQTAVIIRFRASAGGPATRGRAYLPVGVEADQDGAAWVPAFLGEVEVNIDDFIDNSIGVVVGANQVVVSRFVGTVDVVRKKPNPRPDSAITTEVTVRDAIPMIGSQRERRP